jgi:hypothetical protein
MPTITSMLRQLEAKRNHTQTELKRLDEAIAALRKLETGNSAGRHGRPRGRRLSAAARRKISVAQKARWAKVRKKRTVKAGE